MLINKNVYSYIRYLCYPSYMYKIMLGLNCFETKILSVERECIN